MNKNKFLKELKNAIYIANNSYGVSNKYRKRLKSLLKLIQNELINSINYNNCNNAVISKSTKLDKDEYEYYFSDEKDKANNFKYFKKICNDYNISINDWKYTPTLFQEYFTLSFTTKNPIFEEENEKIKKLENKKV